VPSGDGASGLGAAGRSPTRRSRTISTTDRRSRSRIWSRTGRRPLLAAGNTNGDAEMLEFACHDDKPSLRLFVLHDDPEREFAYPAGAEQALERADRDGVVGIKDDWATVF
jgi:hypothetical protein